MDKSLKILLIYHARMLNKIFNRHFSKKKIISTSKTLQHVSYRNEQHTLQIYAPALAYLELKIYLRTLFVLWKKFHRFLVAKSVLFLLQNITKLKPINELKQNVPVLFHFLKMYLYICVYLLVKVKYLI